MMFNIGDMIIYSAHGVSKIDNICEKTFANVTRNYYEFASSRTNEFKD